MSNSKKAESGFKNWINDLQEKRRVVVLDEESFEEKEISLPLNSLFSYFFYLELLFFQ